jgi:hypothetical protein
MLKIKDKIKLNLDELKKTYKNTISFIEKFEYNKDKIFEIESVKLESCTKEFLYTIICGKTKIQFLLEKDLIKM